MRSPSAEVPRRLDSKYRNRHGTGRKCQPIPRAGCRVFYLCGLAAIGMGWPWPEPAPEASTFRSGGASNLSAIASTFLPMVSHFVSSVDMREARRSSIAFSLVSSSESR